MSIATILGILKGVFAFFGSPLGRYVGYGMIALTVYGAGELHGRRVEGEKFDAAVTAAKAAAKAQDDKAAEQQRKDAEDAISELKDQKGKSDARVSELEAQLKQNPDLAGCVYGTGGKPPVGVRNSGRARAVGTPAARPAVVPPAR